MEIRITFFILVVLGLTLQIYENYLFTNKNCYYLYWHHTQTLVKIIAKTNPINKHQNNYFCIIIFIVYLDKLLANFINI